MTFPAPAQASNKSSHAIHLYEDDAALIERVGGFLASALDQGGVAIVIATRPHRSAFESELETFGIDPEEVLRNGRLVALDAAATLGSFARDGLVEPAAFRRVVGGVVQDAVRTGTQVSAYGEMVALLWEAGYVLGAIELEKLWNELGRDLRFSLMCGYPAEAVSRPEDAEALQHVCELHSTVVHTREVAARFEPEFQAPHDARHLVSDALREWGFNEGLVANAELVCTELATNAVVHARTPFSVAVRRTAAGVSISVGDGSRVPPALRDHSLTATSGRGLRLVALLARSWGVNQTAAGKTVWADL